ncbi:MAG: NAD(P)-dependent oxidoreductase [Chitinispirillaceae bacterium]|nr:NAD(P)-dependent oxidoreductase [Chitinispirillaceae bacterium]
MARAPLKRLLVTGASGFLGWNICRQATDTYNVTGVCMTNPIGIDSVDEAHGDLTNDDFRTGLFSAHAPDAVIHTAAAADPNFCQNHPDESAAINVTATVALARQCAAAGIPFLFTSTDLVFDGIRPPYGENDPVNPLNLYGRQKAATEREILTVYPGAIVCRMPLMFGDAPMHAKSFIHPMINALRAGKELRLFTDEYRTPASASDAAAGLLLLLDKETTGIFHLGGPQRLSRYDMGRILAAALKLRPAITPCRQSDIPLSAPRAADVSLDSAYAAAQGYRPHPMEEELEKLDCIRNITM